MLCSTILPRFLMRSVLIAPEVFASSELEPDRLVLWTKSFPSAMQKARQSAFTSFYLHISLYYQLIETLEQELLY